MFIKKLHKWPIFKGNHSWFPDAIKKVNWEKMDRPNKSGVQFDFTIFQVCTCAKWLTESKVC